MASETEIKAAIHRAAEKRAAHLSENVHEAWRLINGPADGAPAGLSVDFYRDYLVVNARAKVSSLAVQAWCDALWDFYSPPGLLLKTFAERASESTSELVKGQFPQSALHVQEGPAQLLAYLDEEFATGLYLDLHDVRIWLGQQSQGLRVLNLFSYTCSFSVHAALGGAARVTSVDASKKALNRGRENMRINGLDPDLHRWFSDDVLTHLKRAVKREDRYELIILDPPAFGRAKGKVFELRKDLDELLDHTVGLLAEEGCLLLSIHTAGFESDRLMASLSRSAKKLGRTAKLLKSFGLPVWDHPVLGQNPGDRGDYLQVLVVEAKCA